MTAIASKAHHSTPGQRQRRGRSLTVVALYMEAAEGASPANYSKLAQVAAYLRGLRCPSISLADCNMAPKELEETM